MRTVLSKGGCSPGMNNLQSIFTETAVKSLKLGLLCASIRPFQYTVTKCSHYHVIRPPGNPWLHTCYPFQHIMCYVRMMAKCVEGSQISAWALRTNLYPPQPLVSNSCPCGNEHLWAGCANHSAIVQHSSLVIWARCCAQHRLSGVICACISEARISNTAAEEDNVVCIAKKLFLRSLQRQLWEPAAVAVNEFSARGIA